jgi:uncharacterized protein (TIRG00374 family)
MSPRARLAARIALSIGLLLLVLIFVDLGEMFRRLRAVDPWLFIGLLALLTADRFLMAFKWLLLVRMQELRLTFPQALRAYYISSFAGLFLPMTVGADVIRAMAVRRAGSIPKILATIALERGLGAISQILLAALSLSMIVVLGLDMGFTNLHLALIVALLLVILLVSLPFSFWLAERVARALESRGSLARKSAELADAYAESRHHRSVIWTFLLLTVIEGFFPIAWYWVASLALGLELPFILFVATIPIVFMVARLPISLGGMGVLEGSFVVLAGLLGIGAEDAFSIVILCRLAELLALLPGAVAYLLVREEVS